MNYTDYVNLADALDGADLEAMLLGDWRKTMLPAVNTAERAVWYGQPNGKNTREERIAAYDAFIISGPEYADQYLADCRNRKALHRARPGARRVKWLKTVRGLQ